MITKRELYERDCVAIIIEEEKEDFSWLKEVAAYLGSNESRKGGHNWSAWQIGHVIFVTGYHMKGLKSIVRELRFNHTIEGWRGVLDSLAVEARNVFYVRDYKSFVERLEAKKELIRKIINKTVIY